MKDEYYKLDINGSIFWQSDNGIFTQKEFKTSIKELGTIYIRKIAFSVYKEEITGKAVILDPNSKTHFIQPMGVIVDVEKLESCSLADELHSYEDLRKKGLSKKYLKILEDFLVNSDLCEKVKIKKEETIKAQKKI